jgi:aspartate racemase
MGGSKHLTVGVLGGLGPEATLDYFRKVLEQTPAEKDQDHVRLLIDNNPALPNRNEAIAGTGPSPGPALAVMAAGLSKAGADFLVLPCNTAHAFEAEIRSAAKDIPFVSMIEETVKAAVIRVPNIKVIGLLAATGCLESRLYSESFGRQNVQTTALSESSQAVFMELLFRIKGGDKNNDITTAMQKFASELVEAGAEAVVSGCTEVPLVLGPENLRVPLINSTDALVDATVQYALGLRPLVD